MNKLKFLRYSLFLILITINIGCDQISKSMVRERLDYHEQIQLAGDHVLLTKVENTGAFLSLGDDFSPLAKTLLLNLLPAIAMLGLLFWLFQGRMRLGMALGICCIIGGGIGNIFDRVAYGSVTDFLYIHVGLFRTGIFNFADVSITFGALFIIALGIWKGRKV
ncbi:MAG: signal peptidase II [Phycisphaerae bacterium]|nr:signal peptidase II [Saprospiraceae bacterium]